VAVDELEVEVEVEVELKFKFKLLSYNVPEYKSPFSSIPTNTLL
jgi:hypothetical protein